MPEANKIKKEEPMVDIDTSGPETEVNLTEENINQVPTEKVPTEEGSTNEEKNLSAGSSGSGTILG